MSWHCLSSSSPVARKNHKCNICYKIIKKGQKYNYRFGVDNGDALSMHVHPKCDDFAANYFDDWDDWDIEGDEFQADLKKFLKGVKNGKV